MTQSRGWARALPFSGDLKEALSVQKQFVLDHTTLTTSKEESGAPAALSFLASRLQLLVIFVLTEVST